MKQNNNIYKLNKNINKETNKHNMIIIKLNQSENKYKIM